MRAIDGLGLTFYLEAIRGQVAEGGGLVVGEETAEFFGGDGGPRFAKKLLPVVATSTT